MWIKFIITVFIFSFSFLAPVFAQPAAVQGSNSADSCCANLENEKIKYFKENQYPEFINFLDSYKMDNKLNKSCVDYYRALASFSRLNYLEEKQSWDDYFANGNDYRDQIVQGANKVIAESNAADC
ncbi:MAG: hypothetical protein PHU59_02570, partial [Candidatus Omnitrophica bacterium]|nr:hypothetical protein [Candidatus Omnitrophota bacterium]